MKGNLFTIFNNILLARHEYGELHQPDIISVFVSLLEHSRLHFVTTMVSLVKVLSVESPLEGEKEFRLDPPASNPLQVQWCDVRTQTEVQDPIGGMVPSDFS